MQASLMRRSSGVQGVRGVQEGNELERVGVRRSACGRVGVWACGRVGVWACGRS